MTKSMDISDESAYLFEQSRKVLRAVTGEPPDNSKLLELLCRRFLDNAGVIVV
ncbi:MAG: hypothetical protein M0Q91_12665 [Methanoregula sp.]|jgi:hypothetical protein|nr:hypothetical protein [Methanoregula sp.]